MKNRMKRILAVVTAMILMASFSVSAAEIPLDAVALPEGRVWIASDDTAVVGDVDGDGDINIFDVSYLQYYLTKMLPLSEVGQRRADIDLNDAADAIDVTLIQRSLIYIDGGYEYIGMEADDARAARQAEIAAQQERERRQAILDEIENFTRKKGVDISQFNGNVDMNTLKKQGYSFVIIRLGYGDDETDQDDPMFETNVRKAEAAGLDWGAYIYSYAMSPGEAKSEVNHTLRLLKGKHPTMPIAFDWEDDSYKQRMGMPSNAVVREIARTYVNGIYQAGYYPMIYTGYYWLKGAFDDDSLFAHCDIWLAQWSTKYDYHDRPIGMWQYGGETNYSESPYITGLSGMFDKNYSYKNYPMIIKAYGYNNHVPLLESYAATGDWDDGIEPQSENLPSWCNGVMGDSLKTE